MKDKLIKLPVLLKGLGNVALFCTLLLATAPTATAQMVCTGGTNPGGACTTDADCPGACTPNSNTSCLTDGDCPGPNTCTLPPPGTCGTPLPVELTSFTAIYTGPGEIQLAWDTTSETDNFGFEVQHHTGDRFINVGFVPGAGTTLEAQSYAYDVAGIQPGTHLFRLKQLDLDGTFSYAGPVEVEVEVPGIFALEGVYPNPFTTTASFKVWVARSQHVEVSLYDAVGRAVQTLFEGTIDAQQPVNVIIDGRDLPSGLYIYRVAGEIFNESRQVILNK